MPTRQCEQCKKPTPNRRFCSRRCSAIITNSEAPRRARTQIRYTECGYCKLPTEKTYELRKYCSYKCAGAAKSARLVELWIAGGPGTDKHGRVRGHIREALYQMRGERCEECGWCEPHPTSGRPPLQIDHVDGNRLNDRPENLKILCPNCHTLTLTWGFFGRSWAEHRSVKPDKAENLGVHSTS